MFVLIDNIAFYKERTILDWRSYFVGIR